MMSRHIKIALLALLTMLFAAPAMLAQVAVRGETVYTMSGPPIKDGVVLIRDGKIERVGAASQVTIPAGYRTLTAKVVTPGLIDAHTVVGLSGYLNQPGDQDQLETSAPIQPELRAIDAYNARETLVGYLRSFGITTIHTGHGPGALVSGQTMIVKTRDGATEASVLNPASMIAVTLGNSGLAQAGRSPGTRSKAIAMLRAELIKAQEYQAKMDSAPADKKPERNLRLDSLARVIKGEIPLLVTAHRATDILSALRVAKEFRIKIVLDGGAEAYLLIDQLKAAGVPVIIHPTMARAGGDTENLSMESPATLLKAGIPIALQSGFEGYVPKTRVVLFEASAAASNGLSFEEALAAVTIGAARILSVDKRVGSLEVGKDGDLALFDGDPFEFTTHVIAVVIDGLLVSQEVR
ncbi:MAG: amidohydrolase family protein [Acidobacteriota bacterium]